MREELRQRALEALHQEDLTPLLVFADWLTSEGDPRGEFITLQQTPSNNKARQKELLAAHAKTWLGDAYPMLSNVSWSQGFPRRARLHHALKEVFPPELETLTHLQCKRGSRLHQTHQHQLLISRALPWLRSVRGFLHVHTLQAWVQGKERRIEHLDLTTALHQLNEQDLQSGRGLPHLRKLSCSDASHPSAWGRWLRLPFAQDVTELNVCSARQSLGDWLLSFPELHLRLYVPSKAVKFERQATEHLRIECTLGRVYDSATTISAARLVSQTLSALPDDGLGSIKVQMPIAYTPVPADAEALQAQIDRVSVRA